jgi:hypothetical protein
MENLIGSKTPLMVKYAAAKIQLASEGFKISAGSWIDEESEQYYVCSRECGGVETFGHPKSEISGNLKGEWRAQP